MKGATTLLTLAASAMLAGCSTASMVDFRIHTPHRHTVQAMGIASPASDEENLYDFLTIDLRAAAPFEFVFLDGHRVLSTNIDAALLERHHAPVAPGYIGGLSGSARGGGNAAGGPYWSVVFLLAADGRVMSLTLQSCDHRLPKLLGLADGTEHFDFPIRQRELAKLFGTPETLRFRAILLDKCRF